MEHGVGFMEKGHYPLALEAFEAAAALEPSFAEVRGEGARTSRGREGGGGQCSASCSRLLQRDLCATAGAHGV